jgi:general secretion pathway protein D
MKVSMVGVLVSFLVAGSVFAAEAKLKMNFVNEDITKIIEIYSKAANQKFIIDPGVRGKVTLLNPEEIDLTEAFNQISGALMLNGYSYVYQGDVIVIRSARNIQRDGVEVLTELPPPRPERMVTWVVTLKNASVDKVNRDLRILTSKDGEMSIFIDTNQLYISDFTSNLYRIKKILDRLDQPITPAIAKVVKEGEADRKKNMRERADRREAFGSDRRGKVPPPAPKSEEE